MRTQKELLNLMLDHFDVHFHMCLCIYVKRLDTKDIITNEEFSYLLDLIEKKIPSKYSDDYIGKIGFYWPVGCTEPRINWIHSVLNNKPIL